MGICGGGIALATPLEFPCIGGHVESSLRHRNRIPVEIIGKPLLDNISLPSQRIGDIAVMASISDYQICTKRSIAIAVLAKWITPFYRIVSLHAMRQNNCKKHRDRNPHMLNSHSSPQSLLINVVLPVIFHLFKPASLICRSVLIGRPACFSKFSLTHAKSSESLLPSFIFTL